MLDAEIIDSLKEEIRVLEKELASVVSQLQVKSDQPNLFEKFGQVIDRVYGTAATLEMKELASYCGTLKKTCYECSRAGSQQANSRVLKLMEAYLGSVSGLIDAISDPESAKRINHAMHLEEQKAKKIHDEIFKFIKK